MVLKKSDKTVEGKLALWKFVLKQFGISKLLDKPKTLFNNFFLKAEPITKGLVAGSASMNPRHLLV